MSFYRIWEWIVDRGADNAPVGISDLRHRAMEELSLTLIAAGTPASGRVVPVVLVDGAYGSTYVRMDPALSADYAGGVIRWH